MTTTQATRLRNQHHAASVDNEASDRHARILSAVTAAAAAVATVTAAFGLLTFAF